VHTWRKSVTNNVLTAIVQKYNKLHYLLTQRLSRGVITKVVAITGHNRTGLPCSVGRSTVQWLVGPTAGSITDDEDDKCQPAKQIKQYWPIRWWASINRVTLKTKPLGM